MAARPVKQPIEGPGEACRELTLLLKVLDELRAPDGCPWDRAQTARSLLPYLLEETYEVIESIEQDDPAALKEELGDLFLHVLFQARLARDQGHFTLEELMDALTKKLVNRHPHVFDDAQADGLFHAKQNWEAAKQREKKRASRLDGIPHQLPALTRAQRIQQKAAHVGFDWDDIQPVWAKVHEEIEELQRAHRQDDADAMEEELGDVLFSLVNLGRFVGVSAEEALRRTIAKFEYRFRKIESELAARNKTLEEATLEEMDDIWNRYRGQEPST